MHPIIRLILLIQLSLFWANFGFYIGQKNTSEGMAGHITNFVLAIGSFILCIIIFL